MASRKLTRRAFLAGAATGAALAVVPRRVVAGSKEPPPSERLNIAGIGAGGRAIAVLSIYGIQHNIAALCDVDEVQGAQGFNQWPGAARYRDFRVMLEKEKGIDAVVVATPDHVHAVAAMAAMQLGKPVFVEKPMAHTIDEVRRLMAAAARYKVATQMGNQGHGSIGLRLIKAWIDKGAIGEVREVHCWTTYGSQRELSARPTDTPPVPSTLDWNLWLGPAPERPYHPAYCPRKWRSWWDFGEGELGDMGCHAMDGAFYALDLPPPVRVTAETSGAGRETAPTWAIVHYEFPKRGRKPRPTLTWYDGNKMPPRPESLAPERRMGGENGGALFMGTKGTIMTDAYSGSPCILPDERMQAYKHLKNSFERPRGHYEEWAQACKGGEPAGSNFGYAGRLTEMVLLGSVAIRAGQPIEWDAKSMRITNVPDALQYVMGNKYREGWRL